jgi:DNA helicase-2/ATP-dependent DNA helicase PcrA
MCFTGNIMINMSMNKEQVEAVTAPISPEDVSDIIIVAGAGSGKTRVIVHRIAFLLKSGVSPSSILSMTFTKKAAMEMTHRLSTLISGTINLKMSTFHSLSADILRAFRPGSFDIIDDNDKRKIIKSLIADGESSCVLEYKKFDSWHSYCRNLCIDPSLYCESTEHADSDKELIKEYSALARKYKQAKSRIGSGVMDFDDLLEGLLLLLQTNVVLREQLQNKWRYILIDEYQDTNKLQFEIVKLLRGSSTQLLQVGDEDQLIYSWRGADIEYILASHKKSLNDPKTRCIILNTNYRSSGNILALSNRVISSNELRTGKSLVTNNPAGEPVLVKDFASCYAEADFVASKMLKWNSDGVEYSGMAILIRANRMSHQLERALIGAGLPYKLHNGVAIFDSREGRLLIALLRFTENPSETFFFEQILETIKMGFGPSAIKKMNAERQIHELDWIGYFRANPKLMNKNRVKEFVFNFIKAKVLLQSGDIGGCARSWVLQWDLMQFYKEEERESKESTLLTLFSVLEDYGHQAVLRNITPSVADFQEQRLLNDLLVEAKGGGVNIMTVHKAKGLEFRRGFVIGMQDGVFNAPQTMDEEDRRLAYVAITRFMEELVLTKSINRMGYNDSCLYSSVLDSHLVAATKAGEVTHDSYYS